LTKYEANLKLDIAHYVNIDIINVLYFLFWNLKISVKNKKFNKCVKIAYKHHTGIKISYSNYKCVN